jgi:hypothetical protein
MRKRLTQWSRLIPLTGALVLLATSALAQMPTPSMSLQGEKKRALTPEEQERQKQIDNDYKAAASKIPEQKANDPWADVRPAPSTPSAKTPAGPKKKRQ